ncbi:Dabb family protein [Paenibacillus mendelii]|uniref:Dabb family protein n=1 Tax=Paenibacillus mendelii TaxID=206163 RepID=A0ABV6JFX0_9BACL|nr:Dabb family protein [Paenibacillus mendelii]MCQ6557693.1 Dabb family protein [Paenibacillus mendelii]
MYEHLVSFRFKGELTSEKEQELLNELYAFKGVIPGIIDITAGVNLREEAQNAHGYSIGLRVTFESLDALRQYGPNPIHQQFVKNLDGILDKVVVVDYAIR